LGKSPVIVDSDLTIAESGAIIGTSPSINLLSLFDFYVSEYLIATYGKEKDRVPQGDRSKWLDNLFCKVALHALSIIGLLTRRL